MPPVPLPAPPLPLRSPRAEPSPSPADEVGLRGTTDDGDDSAGSGTQATGSTAPPTAPSLVRSAESPAPAPRVLPEPEVHAEDTTPSSTSLPVVQPVRKQRKPAQLPPLHRSLQAQSEEDEDCNGSAAFQVTHRRVQGAATVVADMNSTINAMNAGVESVADSVSEVAADVRRARETTVRANHSLGLLIHEELDSVRQPVGLVRDTVERTEESVHSMNTTLHLIERQVSAGEERAHRADLRIRTMNTTVQATHADVGVLDSSLRSVGSQLHHRINATAEAMQNSVEGVNATTRTVAAELTATINATAEATQSAVDGVDTATRTVAAELTAAHRRVQSTETTVGHVNGTLNVIDARLVAIEALLAQITDQSSVLISLETTIAQCMCPNVTDPCDSNPCTNGRCASSIEVDGDVTYSCTCEPGFNGGKLRF